MPDENYYQFSELQKKFLELIDFFDPEPQILDILNSFPELPKSQLLRTITWQAMNSSGKIGNLQYDYQNCPFKSSLTNHPRGPLFRIQEVSWLIKLWESKNKFVPHYAPKHLQNGLKFTYGVDSHLIVSFQKVSTELWLTSNHNPTTVIPLTTENFSWVINQHIQLAQHYLQNKENK